MGQNTYAEWFINMMLGWIRWIANGIAAMFQSNSSHGGSSGGAFISWFADNWITLLVVLVVLGVLTDWLVWMIRWRPYWLWFRKKRVLLDDDIDAILNDKELMKKFAPPTKRKPRFEASPLGRGGRPVPRDKVTDSLYAPKEWNPDYDEEFDTPDIEDPYAHEGEDVEVYSAHYDGDYHAEGDPNFEQGSYSDYEKTVPIEEIYRAVYGDESKDMPAEEEDNDDHPSVIDEAANFIAADADEEEAPAPRRSSRRNSGARQRKTKGGWKVRSKRKLIIEDEDPFSVDEVDFDDPEDDAEFFNAISSEPQYPQYDPEGLTDPSRFKFVHDERKQHASPTVEEPAPMPDAFASLYPEQQPEERNPKSWHTGYSVKSPIVRVNKPQNAPKKVSEPRKSIGTKSIKPEMKRHSRGRIK